MISLKNNNHHNRDMNDIVMEDTTTATATNITTTITCQCSSHRIRMTGIQKNHPWFSFWILGLMVLLLPPPGILVSGSTISSSRTDGNRRIPYPSSQQQQQQHRRLHLWNTQQQQPTMVQFTSSSTTTTSTSSPIAVDTSTSTTTTTTTSSNMIEGRGGEGTSSISTSMDDGNNKSNSKKKSNNNNMIVSLLLYIKDSTIRTTNSCTQLYKNHQRCNHIRQKQSIYRNTIKEQWETTINNNNNINQNTPSSTTSSSSSSSSIWTKEMKQQLQNINGGITYEEYIFLQLGKEDRGKVMNLAFLMYGAPKVLPYALMFNKNMLPSTFIPPKTTSITITTPTMNDNPNDSNTSPQQQQQYYESTLRQYERRQAIINTLYNIEKQFITLLMGEMTNNNNNNNNNFVTNLFTKSSSTNNPNNNKSQQRMILHNVLSEMTNLFQRGMMIHNTTPQNSPKTLSVSGSSSVAASSILQKCESFLYRTNTPFNGLELRLGHVPPCIVQGIANAVFHHGIPNSITQLTPKVFHRRKFVGHLEKITKEDEFLVSNAIDLSTIPYHLLMDTCHDRMIHVSPTSTNNNIRNVIQELRQSLSEWLQLTQSKYGHSSPLVLPPSSSKGSGIITPPPILETAKVHNDINNNVITASSKQSNQKITSVSTSTMESTTAAANVVDSDTPTTPKIYYNGNLARMILMAYYGCASICNHTDEPQSPTIGHVPQLLYSSGTSSSNNKN